MTRTMRAYRVVRWGQPPELTEAPVPVPGPGEVLVEVAGTGLCHSDIAMSRMPADVGESLGWRVPFTLGHEVGGRIAALGTDAGAAGPGARVLAEGDPVVLVSPASCGRCPYCVRGQDSACPHGLVGRGYGRDGGLAEYVVARAPREVVPLRSLDPVVAAPLTDAGATSYHAVRRVLPRLVPGSTAVVIGVGGLGAFAVQLLRVLSPARVVAVDAAPARLEVARELGAHEVVEGVDEATGPALRAATGGEGVHAVLDFVGVDATIAAGLGALRPHGVFALVGSGGGTFRRPWFGSLPREAEVFTFQGSCIADAHEVVALAEAGRIRTDVQLFPFDRVADAYAALEAGELRGRAVVTPGPVPEELP
ncbi:MAG: alcohol dehydrogenase catalytic domain-containing protein [Acidimicrobiia bacterium]